MDPHLKKLTISEYSVDHQYGHFQQDAPAPARHTHRYPDRETAHQAQNAEAAVQTLKGAGIG